MDEKKVIKFNTKRKKLAKKSLSTRPEVKENINKNTQTSFDEELAETKMLKGAQDKTQSQNPENINTTASGKYKKPVLIGAVVLLCTFGAVYMVKAQTFKNRYFPNTVINGVDASYKTPDEIRNIIKQEITSYNLIIKSREQEDVFLSGTQLGLEYRLDNTLDSILKEQKPVFWIWHLSKTMNYGVSKTTEIDETAFKSAMESLPCMEESSFKKPKNAEISAYEKGRGYTVVPSFRGSVLDTEAAYRIIYDSALALSPVIDLASYDNLYKKPDIGDDDPVLLAKIDRLNQYARTVIHYPKSVVLDGDTISQWLQLTEDGSVIVNEESIAEYVKTIAETLDTMGKSKEFHTSYGSSVTIVSKQYGWKIDQAAEAKAIRELLPNGESIEREPVYSSRAASFEENDYGNTYVEINLTAQHLHYYKDGALILESDLVSGNLAKGHRTPPGIFSLNYKQRNAVLRGRDYATPVSYWMPFNGGIGLHDANWRSSFGGNIYKTAGSHGCINLPFSVAKQIYASIEKGCPVICYYIDGTEIQKQAAAAPAPTPPTPAPTDPAPAKVPVAESTPAPKTMEKTSSVPIGPGMPTESTFAPSSDIQIREDAPKASGQIPSSPATSTSQKAHVTPVETAPSVPPEAVTTSASPVQTPQSTSSGGKNAIPVPERPFE